VASIRGTAAAHWTDRLGRTLLPLTACAGALAVGAMVARAGPTLAVAATLALAAVALTVDGDREHWLFGACAAGVLPVDALVFGGRYAAPAWLGALAVTAVTVTLRRWPLRTSLPPTALLLAAGFAVWVSIASLRSPVRGHALAVSLQYALLIVIALAVAAQVAHRGLASFGRMLLGTATLMAVVLTARLVLAGDVLTGAGDFASAKSRSFESVGNVNVAGALVMVFIPLALALFLSARGGVALLVRGSVLALLALAVGLTLARSAILGAAAGAAVTYVLTAKQSRKRAGALLAFVALVVVAFTARPELVGGDWLSYKLDGANGRTDIWAVAVNLWREAPLLGHGAGTFERLVEVRSLRIGVPGTSGFGGDAHNQYLSALVAGGLPLLLVELALIGVLLAVGLSATWKLRAAGETVGAAVAAGAVGALVALSVRGLLESGGMFDLRNWLPDPNSALTVVAWLVVGLILGASIAARRVTTPMPTAARKPPPPPTTAGTAPGRPTDPPRLR
jgi:O-antigen ligase